MVSESLLFGAFYYNTGSEGRNMDIIPILAVAAVAVMAIIIRIGEDKEE